MEHCLRTLPAPQVAAEILAGRVALAARQAPMRLALAAAAVARALLQEARAASDAQATAS
jgi:hypothetical protein